MVLLIALVMIGVAGAAPFFYDLIKNYFADDWRNGVSIPSMIENYTEDKREIKLTIGILQDDQLNFKVFGTKSEVLEPVEYEYEIGSVSKTFTASMLCKAINDGQIDLDAPVSRYLSLDSNTFYPTVLSLATHTSGYGEYPFDSSTLSKEELERVDKNFYEKKRNIYQGIHHSDVLKEIEGYRLKNKAYDWEYSNFGIAVLGTVLEDVTGISFRQLVDGFVSKDLGLTHTRIGNGQGNLSYYWNWDDEDAYIAAAGVVSTVTDMLKYGQMHLNDTPDYLVLSHKTRQVFEEEGISMGLGWIIDPEKGYLWHNGGTSSCTSFLGIDKENGTAVVILSNYPERDDTRDDGVLDLLGYTLLDSLGKGESDIL